MDWIRSNSLLSTKADCQNQIRERVICEFGFELSSCEPEKEKKLENEQKWEVEKLTRKLRVKVNVWQVYF